MKLVHVLRLVQLVRLVHGRRLSGAKVRHGRATMPWGKYKGVRVRLLPNDYLSWLTTSVVMTDPRWDWLKESLISELKFRGLNYEMAGTKEPDVEWPEPPQKSSRLVAARRRFRA